MAIGGRNIGTWDNTTPATGDDSGLGDDHFRSVKTSIQTVIDAEHEFSTVGGANTGRHRPGSAMPYNDVQSNVSAGDLQGRLYFASDKSRLFALGDASSRATIYLGGVNSIEAGTDTGVRNVIWVQDAGHKAVIAGIAAVQFATDYDSVPYVMGSSLTDSSPGPVNVHFSAVTVGGFTAQLRYGSNTDGNALDTASIGTLMWMSLGTRSI